MEGFQDLFGQWTFGWGIPITIVAFIVLTFLGRWGRRVDAAWSGDDRPKEGALKIRIPGAIILGIAVGGYFQAGYDDWNNCIDAESRPACTYEEFLGNSF